MPVPNSVRNYIDWARKMIAERGEDQAMSMVVGGNYEAYGILQRCLLIQCGLKPDHTLIDVGCGSGRLPFQLRDYLTGRYIGIDVVPELLKYAQEKCARPDWKFYLAPGLTIPEPDASADFISFFSVFTHLLHRESYPYLQDALRVLKPRGRLVFSYVEFAVRDHWGAFEGNMANPDPDKILLQFMSREGIRAWADHLHVGKLEFHRGDERYVKLDRPLRWDNGAEWGPSQRNFGQSLCILTK